MARNLGKIILILLWAFSWHSNSQDYRVKASVVLDPTNSYIIGERSNYYIGMGGLSFSPSSNSIDHFEECIVPFSVSSRTDYVIVADNQRSKTCYFDWSGPLPSIVNTYVEGNIPVTIGQTVHNTFSVTHINTYGKPITPCINYSSWDTNTSNRPIPALTEINFTFIPYHEKILNTIPGSILTIDQKFKLEFQSGNMASGWRYSVDNGTNWVDFGDTELSLLDLGISRDNLPNNQIMLQGIACGDLGVFSNIILIDVIPNSPLLINTEHTDTSCYGSKDGSVTLTFDRNMEPGYKMRYFLYDANANINFDPTKENPPQTLEQEILSGLIPKNDGSDHYSGALSVGLSHGNYKIVYQEFYDSGNSTDTFVKSGGITEPFTIERPSQITLDTSAPNFFTDAICGMPATFTLDHTALGGNLVPNGNYSYEYSLDDGLNWLPVPNNVLEIEPTTDSRSVWLRGVYTVNGNNCLGEVYPYSISAITESIIVTDSSTGSTTTPEATDGSLRVALSGGTPPYSYSIFLQDTDTNVFNPISVDPFPVSIPGGMAVSFNGLPSGTFHVTVVDSNDCIQISPDLFIGTDPIPVLGTPETTQMDCEGSYGSIRVPVSDSDIGYRYQWTGNGMVSPIHNGNGPDIFLDNITAAGTYTFRVSAGRVSDVDFENDVNIALTSVQIKEPITVTVINAVPGTTSCNDTDDGSIALTLSGGTSYEYTLELFPAETDWIPLTGTMIKGLAPGSYRITVRNEDGCKSDPLQNIIVNRAPLLEPAIMKTDATTYGGNQGSIRLDITGGTPFSPPTDPYAITWQKDNLAYSDTDPSTPYLINGLTAGSYSVTVTDTNGCTLISSDIIIQEPEMLAATIAQTLLFDCHGEDYAEITATVQGGMPPYSYEWYQIINGNNRIIPGNTGIKGGLSVGTYFLRLMDGNNNVVNSKQFTITQPDALIARVDSVRNVYCKGERTGAIFMTVSGGTAPYSYFWNNGTTTRNLIDVEAGHYTLEIRDANECYLEVEATIDFPPDTIQIVDTAIDHVSEYGAEDGSISLGISGGTGPYTVNWIRLSDNSDIGNRTMISGLSADNFQIMVTDSNGCSTTEVYGITQPDIVEEIIVPPTCWDSFDGHITVLVNQGNGDYTYNWNTGENTNTISNLNAGNYTVTINGFGNQPIIRTYTVEAPPPLFLDLEKNRTICKGQDLILYSGIAKDSANYSWTSDMGFTSNDPNALVNVGGNYTLTVTSKNGCSITETVFVASSNEEINAEFAISSQVFIGESLIAVDISYPLPETQEWILPAEGIVVKQDPDEVELIFNEAGEYEIGIISTIGNCTAQQTKKVLVMANDSEVSGRGNNNPGRLLEKFTLHPNPTSGRFVADVLLPETGAIGIKVFNFANNALMARKKARGGTSYSIPLDLSGLPAGIYAVVLETPYGNALRKIILD